jgi:YHS domain-containing protein
MRKLSLLIALGLLLASAPIVQAQEEMAEDMGAKAEDVVKASEVTAVEVGNKVCPVSGNEIDMEKVVKFEYNGKIYNLCCADCIAAFANDPEKFAKIAEESLSTNDDAEDMAEGEVSEDEAAGEEDAKGEKMEEDMGGSEKMNTEETGSR